MRAVKSEFYPKLRGSRGATHAGYSKFLDKYILDTGTGSLP